ncbi:MAG: hypothetical protein RAO94_12955 [Candidatus Stygibacter australis]|nr:hypothetical protein [Candidatus Stygibacter australis]MDP8323250.1 hypothetical protein [Candidatus Stygibacter australis]
MNKQPTIKNIERFDRSNYFSSSYSRKRKTDWAGIPPGYAYNFNQSYYIRQIARSKYYSLLRKAQKQSVRLLNKGKKGSYQPVIKAQLDPFFSKFPSILAAYSSIGLTTYLEYINLLPKDKNLLEIDLEDAIDDLMEEIDPEFYIDEDCVTELTKVIKDAVFKRVNLEVISREKNLFYVEIYRLFSASHQSLKFRSLSDIARAVILYGDVLVWDISDLHPMTKALLDDIFQVSENFLTAIGEEDSANLIDFCNQWILALIRCLAKYLPSEDDKYREQGGMTEDIEGYDTSTDKKFKYYLAENFSETGSFHALAKPRAPELFDPRNEKEKKGRSFVDIAHAPKQTSNVDQEPNPIKKLLEETIDNIDKASGNQSNWENKRSDLLTQDNVDFMAGEIQGEFNEGHEVEITVGKNKKKFKGEIFERPVELSYDEEAISVLMQESEILTRAMKNQLYPNVIKEPVIRRIKTSGTLDSSRLAIGDFSEAIFKRHRIQEISDKRGKPVLLIAADGSGSLNSIQMKMLKLLTAAWLRSTTNTDIDIMAGLYHSGDIRKSLHGPLVQWMYHSQKTLCVSKQDALRTLITLPDTGTGCQSDAVSIAFMIQEARKMAKGRMIYLILISDCCWNVSFREGMSGAEEVEMVIKQYYEELEDKLHVTLVALGQGVTGFEDVLDKVIPITNSDLNNIDKVASQIGLYVASTMRERRKLIKKGR